MPCHATPRLQKPQRATADHDQPGGLEPTRAIRRALKIRVPHAGARQIQHQECTRAQESKGGEAQATAWSAGTSRTTSENVSINVRP